MAGLTGDIGDDYAASLQRDDDARLESEFAAAAASDPAPTGPSSPPTTVEQTQAMEANGTDTPANMAARSLAANVRETPLQLLFGAASGVKQVASKVGLGDGAPVGREPTTVGGGIARGVGQFMPGYMAASALITALPETLAGAGLVALAAKAKPLVAGIAAGTLDFDPKEPRISNFIQETGLANPLTDFLAADPNDGTALATFKSAVENAGLGVATEGVVALARLNQARIVANRALEKAGAKSPEQLADSAMRAATDVLDPVVDMKSITAGDPKAPLFSDTAPVAASRLADAQARAPLTSGGEQGVADAAYQAPQGVYLNLARIDTADDVRAAIDTLASRDADAINAARGGEHQTFAEVNALADAMGVTPQQIIGRERGPMAAGEAVAARKLLTSTGEQLVGFARRAASADATAGDLAAFQRATAVHYALQTEVIAARTETARALASWRIPAPAGGELRLSDVHAALTGAGGPDAVAQVARRLSMVADNPAALATVVRAGFETNWKGAFQQLWFNGLLSSPRTQVANTVDNALTAAFAIPERAATALVSQTFGGGDVSMGEAEAMFWGLLKGTRDGVTAAGKALRTGESSDLFTKTELQRPSAIRAETFGADPARAIGHGINAIGRAVDVPSRLLMSADEFFKAVNYRMELHALSFRQARSEGLTGAEFGARVADIIADPPRSLREESVAAGRERTYTSKLGPIGQAVAKVRDVVPGAHFVAPFVRTPANIMRFTFERTPLAPLSASVRADISAGGARQSAALARIGLGTTMMIAAADMVANGEMVGGGPGEPSMRAARERQGIPQYAIKVGGSWVSFERLGYLGTLLGLAADGAEMTGLAGFEDSEKTLASVGLLFVKSMANKSYLQGVFKAASILSDPNSDRSAAEFAKQIGATMVPFSGAVGSLARSLDPTQRETRTAVGDPGAEGMRGPLSDSSAVFVREFIDKVRSRTPGLSGDLPPALDLWGRPKEYTSNLGVAYDFAIPFKVSQEKRDAVDRTIVDNGINVDMPTRSIQGVPLTGAEYSEFVRLAGEPAKAALDAAVSTEEFKAYSDGPDGLKAAYVKQVIDGYRSAARDQMRVTHPELEARIQAQASLRAQLLSGGQ